MMVLDAAISGDDQRWPPGFRFHPTDEELVLYYLKRKICRRRLKLDIIGETDVYKWDPEELPGLSKLKTGDRLWFFFSHRDRKYPNGARSNRATRKGYWKATGKDRQISCNSRSVGVKKTLVFYKGRAPTGERTDWVMHEYTLDEEELQRCPMVKDYYALYKLFKKSGPGPKNGEQYGAPFREEEWVDDDNLNTENPAVPEVSLKLIDAIPPVNTCKAKAQVESPLVDDLEEFMNRIADDPVVIQPLAVNYDQVLHELIGEEETEFIFDNQSLTEANLCEQSVVLHPSSQHNCFGPTQSTTSHMQNNDISDVTSDLSCYQQKTQVEDDLFEDFLEMDDLLDSEPSCQNVGKPSINFEDLDGLSEFDLFQDANMFLQGDGSINAEHLPELYYTNNQNEMVPPTLGGSSHNFAHEVLNAVSESYYGNAGPLDYQLQNHASDANGVINNQFWVPDQNCNNFAAANELNQQAFTSQSSGVVNDGISSNFYAGVNQIQNQNPSQNEIGEGENGGDSWLSSALWAFVESIPSNPASASETNALVNKAFERVSSFRRLRINVADANAAAAAGNTTANKRRCGGGNNYRRLYIFSVVGVVCAALWMFNC